MKNALSGKTVAVTRAVAQAGELIFRLKRSGAEVLHIPTIELVPPDSWAGCDRAIEKLQRYDWVIFTSVNGVRFFTTRLQQRGKRVLDLRNQSIAAVGDSTAATLKDLGLQVALVPTDFRAEGLITAFESRDLREANILLIKPQKSRNVLTEKLTLRGANVDAVAVYKNQPVARHVVDKFKNLLNGHAVDVLTFTSPSTARNFIEVFGKEKVLGWKANGCRIAAIGCVTQEALNEYDLNVDILPKKSTIASLVEGILEYYS